MPTHGPVEPMAIAPHTGPVSPPHPTPVPTRASTQPDR
jgi:hypothetical protein